LFSVSNEEVKRNVDMFFNDLKESFDGEGEVNDERKRILDLQMKLQSKDALIDSYSKEIDKLQVQLQDQLVGASRDELASMYNDITA